ncbi:MAG: hypothetical protein Q9182_002090 [Xanthomendoza sp. 2 TL-2023]
MACFSLSKSDRLLAIILISFSFFIAEIVVGFTTHSLALIADSFHYLSDLIGFVVALVALRKSEREDSPSNFTFGWQRIQLLGAFFNGVFLIALGLSIFLQSLERFVAIEDVEKPELVLAMGCVGLTLNIISALFLHEHHHDEPPPRIESTDDVSSTKSSATSSLELPVKPASPHHLHHHHDQAIPAKPTDHHHHDLNMTGVLLHVISDAINNLGIIIAALIIILCHSSARFYADPSISLAISFIICLSAYPLVIKSGSILLQAAPKGVDLDEMRKNLERIAGVVQVYELHIWRLSQWKSVATAHVLTTETGEGWERIAKEARKCLCKKGVHSVTLEPEMIGRGSTASGVGREVDEEGKACARIEKSKIGCGDICRSLRCCG